MANLFQAPPAAPFDVHDPNNVEIRWDRWKKRLEAYITATELGDDHQKRALLYSALEKPFANYLTTILMPETQKTAQLPHSFSLS